MLRIAVELPADFATAGEFLADARAYEAAGAEAVWLGRSSDGLEPLVLLAACAAVTTGARLAATVAAADQWAAPRLNHVLRALDRLSGDRVVLGVEAGAATDALIAALRSGAPRRPILVTGADDDAAVCAARLGDGLLCPVEVAAAAFGRARAALPEPEGGAAAGPFELWARVPAPAGRAAWRQLLEEGEQLGASGVVVAHAANLLDILRNPEEDDRQDLAMAVG
jgi:alkanesulfonate monooxygenase SsuD/methylene tetrahydromethanopterin reductase-like flavin-dependent oxidoreductase (luciferase family)